MTNNKTEFANQDEEISYKEMWLRLNKDLANLIKDNERDSVLHVHCHEFAMECLARAYGFGKVLERMDEIEKENGK